MVWKSVGALTFAVIISIFAWILLRDTYSSRENAGLLGFLAGLAATFIFAVVQVFILAKSEPPALVADASRGPGVLGFRSIILLMSAINLMFILVTQAIMDSAGYAFAQPGVTSEALRPHLTFLVAGFATFVAAIGLVVAAFLIGIAAKRVRFWYFFIAALIPNLTVALPRIVILDRSTWSGADILRIATGRTLTPDAVNGPYADFSIMAVQIGILIASMVGAALLWWACALLGGALRALLSRSADRSVVVAANG